MDPVVERAEGETKRAGGQLDGLVAIVTGGASGIGAAVAGALHAEGAQIAVLDRDIAHADAAFAAFTADVSDRESVDAAVAAVAEKFGRIDIVINNAGVGAQGDIAANDDDEWARVLSINVTGIARVTAAALPWLRRSPAAAVCNTASIASTTGLPQRALYSASKGAVSALTRAMAADHLREGIRVNAVNPGTADTPWVGRLLDSADDPAAERAALNARQPHGRLVSPDEVAGAVLYLVSPLSGSTTGTCIEVDGGMAQLRLRSE
ncbi:SDR family NAD(P)-dependent oxidoreductase [Microbacterium esteraromaticum]|uniref:SDR family NAD(P)-dependent oxidoreductase n=1 Tax=Microbacterium esteraromaticum TaxID=57043 RepID=UPI0019D3F969|nr:SDR family oxidoreductase [Microbacterium esteraromaticum]MBN7794286.1 SDR family oxidoreductase [Microbacterium esteraromaticum]